MSPRDDDHTDVEPLITKVTTRAETAQDMEIVQQVYADELSAPVKAPAPPPEPPAAPDDSIPEPVEEEDSAWTALFSYETYEQVARRVLRAGTEVAREGYQRHDAAVIVIALALIIGGGIVHRRMMQPPMEVFDANGLTFQRTANWLSPEPVLPAPVRLIRDAPAPPRPAPDELPYHVEFTSALDADVRLEVLVDDRPRWSNILTGLELDRRNRYGELYASDGGHTRSISGHDWLRTSYRYAYAPDKGDAPRIGRAVEYATVDRDRLYAVTFHGAPVQIEYLEDLIAPTMRVASKIGVPLLPQNRVTQVRAPQTVRTAQASTVMVVVADLVDGRLRAVGGGSGVIVASDGSIATNYHVLHERGRLHDLFVIGRHVADGKPPQLVCAGSPNRSKLQPELDLAMIKCDMDLDGRAWKPTDGGAWQPLVEVGGEVSLGQRLWVLGYPDRGGGAITLSQGLVEGWTGEEDTLGKDFIKTDASLTHGNSGGPVVDDLGRVIGVANAFRVHLTQDGDEIESVKQGLVRPWSALGDILEIAGRWTPREGRNSVELEPTEIEVAPEGVVISTTVVDALNLHPIPGALLLVLRPDVSSDEVDMNRLNDQVIAWGRANAEGEVHLKHPVPQPGRYTVVVVARGYQTLTGDDALQLDEDTAPFFDPWGQVKIHPL